MAAYHDRTSNKNNDDDDDDSGDVWGKTSHVAFQFDPFKSTYRNWLSILALCRHIRGVKERFLSEFLQEHEEQSAGGRSRQFIDAKGVPFGWWSTEESLERDKCREMKGGVFRSTLNEQAVNLDNFSSHRRQLRSVLEKVILSTQASSNRTGQSLWPSGRR
jgi:hypothetical protein